MVYAPNTPRLQNRTLPKEIQEFLGTETFAEAFEQLPENQMIIEDIEAEVADVVQQGLDCPHGPVKHNPVAGCLRLARKNFIVQLHHCGLSVATIHRLVNLCDIQYGWGQVGRKTIQRALPKHGVAQ